MLLQAISFPAFTIDCQRPLRPISRLWLSLAYSFCLLVSGSVKLLLALASTVIRRFSSYRDL
jgi:hypothetical protein